MSFDFPSLLSADGAPVWAAALCTLAIWTFLIRDNPIYRLAEHVMVALAAGWGVGYYYYSYIHPVITEELIGQGRWFYIIPIILGLFLYTRFIPSVSWLARYPMSAYIGYGAGYYLAFNAKPFLSQVTASFVSFSQPAFTGTLNQIVFFICILASLVYFFFTISKERPAMGYASQLGKIVILIALGAHFGNTVLYRYNLFLGRLSYVLGEWMGLLQ
ncbi:MAG: hypothetical protein RDU89_03720 [bacterium]|nr:hypothetical protein [bacterium]